MLSDHVVNLARDFMSLLYPNCCSACSMALVKGENLICSRCLLEMPQTQYHLDPGNDLKRRLEGRIPVQYVLGFLRFTKNGRIQNLLHNLKYRHQPEIGVALGKLYAQRLKDSGLTGYFDLIIPVPLHKSRLRKRGYNQSAKFAEGLSQTLGIPVEENILFRKSKTETQTRKNKLKRWENVSEVFGVVGLPSAIAGKHILLTDDVITTGATIEACAEVLIRNGCGKISVACIAVA